MLSLCLPLLLLFETILSDKREQQGTRKNPGSFLVQPAYPKLIKSSSRRLTSPCRANNFPPPSNPIPFLFGSHAWFSHRDKVISAEINYSSRGENANSPVGEGGNLYAACRGYFALALKWPISFTYTRESPF